ncbi:MAG TPA: intradiol ring-cleavage dioxygenase [Aggregatilineales bacterium]|nr:intradiol ring-cleavage dioxygenase [Aggregatilineales bacterium]
MEIHDLHDDDMPVGRILTRREVLALLGSAGTAMVAGTALTKLGLSRIVSASAPLQTPTGTVVPACVVRPALTEGPYFVDEMLNRSDIRIEPSDGSIKEGTVLRLMFQVSDISADACMPLEGAQVDIWHCDALGVYSGVTDPGFDTSEQYWLRGYQVTDKDGVAEFITIYPGWYSGRAVHIHFKIRTDPAAEAGYEFTSQLFFPEETNDLIHAQQPYASKGYRNVLNKNDGIYRQSGDMLLLNVVEDEEAEEGEEGYVAIFDIALDTSDMSSSTQSNGAPGGGGRPSGEGRP